jgi:Ca2+-binding EF-hand superfamily protein
MRNFKIAILTAACLCAGGAMASPPQPGDTTMGGRMGAKFFADFDLNHDGKVTKAEMEKVLAQRFAAASGGKPVLTEAQFTQLRMDAMHKRSDMMFRRVNWSGDGKLSRDEFIAVARLRFERMDHDGTGVVPCHRESASGDQGEHHGRGATSFCAQFDQNHDGKVTRAEFDAVSLAKYQAAAKGGGLTADGWFAMAADHLRQMQTHAFDRLDTAHSGKLTLAEFSAPVEKMFAHIDKNNDGVITQDELSAMHSFHGFHGHKSGADQAPG